MYKREQTQRKFRTNNLIFDSKLLRDEFDSKHREEQLVYKNIANNFVQQGYSLHHNIVKVLEKTSGNMSYAAIANHLGGIVTKSTVSKHLQSLEGFATTKSIILPQLSKDCMERRKRFCKEFFFLAFS